MKRIELFKGIEQVYDSKEQNIINPNYIGCTNGTYPRENDVIF